MRRILKYKYYNVRWLQPKCYRVKILNSKKQKWKFFIKKQGWFIRKLLRKARFTKKRIKRRIYFRRKKRSKWAKFKKRQKNKYFRRKKKQKKIMKTRVKKGRWLRLKKANLAFLYKRAFYSKYEKFFCQRYLKAEYQNANNKKKIAALKAHKIKPLFFYAVLLFEANLLSTIHESTHHLRSHFALQNKEKIKYNCIVQTGSFYSVSLKKSWQLTAPLKEARAKYKKKRVLLLFTEIDYYAKSFVLIKNISELKNKECSLLV